MEGSEAQTPTSKSRTCSSQLAPRASKWPKTRSAQAGAVHSALTAFPTGASATDVAKTFGLATAGRVERIEEILETLAAHGKARELPNDHYLAT